MNTPPHEINRIRVLLQKGDRVIYLPSQVGDSVFHFFRTHFEEAFAFFTPSEEDGRSVVDLTLPLGETRYANGSSGNAAEVINKIELQKGDRVMYFAPQHRGLAAYGMWCFDYNFSGVVPSQRGTTEVVDFSEPALHTFKESGLQFWINSYGEYESVIDRQWPVYKPSEGDVIFDGGAHNGIPMYFYSKLVGETGRVISFEPDPENCEIIRRNIELHQLKNVTLVQAALAGSCGHAEFESNGSTGSHLSEIKTLIRHTRRVSVRTTTIAQAYADLGLSRLDFIKMDIEGAETDAVLGSLEFLRSRDLHLSIGCHHRLDPYCVFTIMAALKSAGYTVTHDPLVTDGPEIALWADKLARN